MGMDANIEAVAPRISDDRLLLDEFTHRTANELAAATAAIRIALRMQDGSGRDELLEEAARRLEASGKVNRLLSSREHGMVDAGERLRGLCCAIASSRSHLAAMLTLDVSATSMDAATTRRLLMVASELVTNSIRHALGASGSRMLVRLATHSGHILLTVEDDGPGIGSGASTSGTGLGGGIVRELVARAGGRIETRTGPGGTRIRVALPIMPSPAHRRTRS